jgi:hypothetical protein
MRPIPDDVEPVPQQARGTTLADGGGIALADAGARFVELQHTDRPAACMDARHHVLRVQQIASDRWVIGRGVVDLVRTERKAQMSQQIDAVTGHVVGLSVDDIGDGSCLGAMGFRTGDVLRTLNGRDLVDWSSYGVIYQSIMKDGNAVVRFDRAGHTLTVLYEVRNE